MRDYEEAVRWLEMGKKTPVVSQDVSVGKTFEFNPCTAELRIILFF